MEKLLNKSVNTGRPSSFGRNAAPLIGRRLRPTSCRTLNPCMVLRLRLRQYRVVRSGERASAGNTEAR